MKTIFIKSKFIKEACLDSNPQEDFGFNYEDHETYNILGDKFYDKTDVGLVSINVLMAELRQMQNNGANYVACDWHCDHEELDLYSYSLSETTSDEVQTHIESLYNLNQKNKEKEIAELEKRLELLKKDLENPK